MSDMSKAVPAKATKPKSPVNWPVWIAVRPVRRVCRRRLGEQLPGDDAAAAAAAIAAAAKK